jgi:hypothetical protein
VKWDRYSICSRIVITLKFVDVYHGNVTEVYMASMNDTISRAMEDEEPLIWVHVPASRVAFVLDLVEGTQVPLASALHAPEGIIRERVNRLNVANVVGAALGCYPSILHLNVGPHRARTLHDRWYRCGGGGCPGRHWRKMAVRHRVRCGPRHEGGRRDHRMGSIHNRRSSDSRRVVVRPLVRVIIVSIHANTEPIAGVGRVIAIRGVAGVVVTRGVSADGNVWAVVEWAGVVVGRGKYPRVVATSDDAADTTARDHAGMSSNEATLEVAARRDVGGCGTIWNLAVVDQDATPPGLGDMKVGVARLWEAVLAGHGGERVFCRSGRGCDREVERRERESVCVCV